MIIAISIYICINLFHTIRRMKGEPMSERLPWILYLCSAIGTIPGLIIYAISLNLINENNILLVMLIKIISLCIIIGPIIAGFLFESFKPSWRHSKTRWWLLAGIPFIIAGYCYLVFILNNDGYSSNGMSMMIDLGVLVLLPFIASIFTLAKAPDKDNLLIYRLISTGFSFLLVSTIIFMTYYRRGGDLFYLIVIAYFVSPTIIAYATYLKRNLAEKREEK